MMIATRITDTPGKTGTPEITDWDETSVNLKWEAPKSTGGAPITGYVVEKKEKFGSNWEEIFVTDVTCTLPIQLLFTTFSK